MSNDQHESAGAVSPGSFAEVLQHFAKEKKRARATAQAVARLLSADVIDRGAVSVSEVMDEIEGYTFGVETARGQRVLVTVSAA